MSNQKDIDLVHRAACETHGRVVWTHKAHEIEREDITQNSGWLSFANIAVAGLTTGLAVASPLLHDPRVFILTAMVAAVNVCLVITQASLDYPQKESQQRTAAKEILCLRDELEDIITRCQMSDADPFALRAQHERLKGELHRVYKFTPNTSRTANNKTTDRIHAGEMSFTDAERAVILPKSLRGKPSAAEFRPGDNASARLPKASGQD